METFRNIISSTREAYILELFLNQKLKTILILFFGY